MLRSSGNYNTVEPLLSGPLLSGQPLFGGQRPKSRENRQLHTVIKTSKATSINKGRDEGWPLNRGSTVFDKLKTGPSATLFSGD